MTGEVSPSQTESRQLNNAMLLLVDAAIDLALGAALIAFPRGVMKALGVPIPSTHFYPSILGAVLIGVGMSLVIERFHHLVGVAGLGLAGAIIINSLGGGTLIWWLVNGDLHLPLQASRIERSCQASQTSSTSSNASSAAVAPTASSRASRTTPKTTQRTPFPATGNSSSAAGSSSGS